MKLELYEARGNLDKINSSILLNTKFNFKNAISPESDVYVDKLRGEKGTHTWANVTDNIVMQPDVAFVVVRSNKRQLLLISHNEKITNDNGKYLLVWSDIAMSVDSISELTNDRDMIITSSNINVQSKMWKTVENYINATNGRKNWDIIVVKIDKNLEPKREERKKAKQGVEIKPSDKNNYSNYINRLKDNLTLRLKQFSESKLFNIQSEEDFRNLVSNEDAGLFPKKIKIANIVYKYYSLNNTRTVSNDSGNNIVRIQVIYVINDYRSDLTNLVKSIVYTLEIRAAHDVKITDVYFSSSDYSGSKSLSFEDGLKELIDYNKTMINKNG